MQPVENAIQLSDKFDAQEGLLTLYGDNRDFCPYYLFITFTDYSNLTGMSGIRSATLPWGNHAIMSFSLSDKTKGYNYRYSYSMYRGDPKSKINIDFPYTLPTAKGATARMARTTENREGYQLSFEVMSDTVYACRGGMMCNDDLRDHTAKGNKNFDGRHSMSQITLYHGDGSFGEYVFKGKSLVYPGQRVKMGQAIGIIETMLDSYFINFSVYFLDKNKVDDRKVGNKHTHFRPFFQTANAGKLRLEREQEYVCELTDEMLMQDMSKKEQKKFLKEKSEKR
ncbi:MAG: M23 family metallopeptidase [Dysgonamonadaceae bacterium]|nr:M23 family metallopeptidase [Dysgonamonadaceae bacterium]